jgi:uncharacterized protein (DUF2164 family)
MTTAQAAINVVKALHNLSTTGEMSSDDLSSLSGGIAGIIGDLFGMDEKQKSYTSAGATAGGSTGNPWAALIGALIGFVIGSNNPYKKYESTNKYSLAEASNAANQRSGQMGQIKNYQDEIVRLQEKLKAPIPKEFQNQGYGTYIQGIKNGITGFEQKIRQMNDDMMKALDDWTKAIGVTVDDIAGQISNAFQADNYMDFLSNWNKNLYETTREALIRGN